MVLTNTKEIEVGAEELALNHNRSKLRNLALDRTKNNTNKNFPFFVVLSVFRHTVEQGWFIFQSLKNFSHSKINTNLLGIGGIKKHRFLASTITHHFWQKMGEGIIKVLG